MKRSSPVHFELPVALFGDGNVGEVSLVILGVTAAKNQLTTWSCTSFPGKGKIDMK